MDPPLRITYIGGPTALIEWGGLNLLTDPTFDPASTKYPAAAYTLRKTMAPGLAAYALPRIDAVLLSHDHHADNLDRAGRDVLSLAGRVFTTPAGVDRLSGVHVEGIAPWETRELRTEDGRTLRVTGTPARHGPAHGDRGPVVGFVLAYADDPANGVYVSGDTVWYEGVQEVSSHFSIRVALLFMGAARVPAVGDWPLTMTATDAVEAARAFSDATIVPLHFEGWGHLSESRTEIDRAFRAAGLHHRLDWLPSGRSVSVPTLP